MNRIKVLVVDDSATMRRLITTALATDPAIEVVGHAEDPLEARKAIKVLNPDVVTLDIEMPNMNGLEFLDKIMRLRPMPVIMVSTLTGKGADATITALGMGAIDCVEKPRPGNDHGFRDLARKVKIAAAARVRSPALGHKSNAEEAARAAYAPDGRVVAIGSSTGGVEALMEILSAYPANGPPTVIVQHMPKGFTSSLAQRLDRMSAANVQEAFNGAQLEAGRVYLAPGGSAHLEIVKSGSQLRCALKTGDKFNGHSPSVDILFRSVAKACGSRSLGVILTGMGRDGADGLLEIRSAGGVTIGQNEVSCIVYGMPRVSFEIGAVCKQLPLESIGAAIVSETNTKTRN